MSCEHHGHCHHHEEITPIPLVSQLGSLCCQGQCSHAEHRANSGMQSLDAFNALQRQLLESDDEDDGEDTSSKKKKKRYGQLLTVQFLGSS